MGVLYTNEQELNTRISSIGVLLRTDHDRRSLNQSEEWASRQIDFYLQPRYPNTDLSQNGWTKYVACVLATYHLCWTRLNSIPSVVQKEYDGIMKQMEGVANGTFPLPGAGNPGGAPALINQRVALGFYPPVVTESNRSVGPGVPPPRREDPYQPVTRI